MGHGVGSGQETLDPLLAELTHFRGEEQEDDIIPLTLERSKADMTDRESTLRPDATGQGRGCAGSGGKAGGCANGAGLGIVPNRKNGR